PVDAAGLGRPGRQGRLLPAGAGGGGTDRGGRLRARPVVAYRLAGHHRPDRRLGCVMGYRLLTVSTLPGGLHSTGRPGRATAGAMPGLYARMRYVTRTPP